MKEITFGKDQVIFHQGDESKVMYDILSGKVGVYKDYKTEKEKLVTVLGPEQTLGEMGMIEYFPRSATAVALEDTVLQEIGEDEIREYFRNKPEKLLQLMKLLSQRIRETTQKYLDVCRVISERERAEAARDAEETKKLFAKLMTFASFYNSNGYD